MKNLKLLGLLFVTLCLIYSCSKDDTESSTFSNSELMKALTVNETTNTLSSLFRNMGVQEIEVVKNDGYINYRSITGKTFSLNGVDTDLSEFEIYLENDFIRLKNNTDYGLTLKNEQLYAITPGFEGYLKNMSNIFDNRNLLILMLYLNEITLAGEFKTDSYSGLQNKAGCSFWDTYYIYSVNATAGSSQAGLEDEVEEYTGEGGSLEGCTLYGGSDTSCAWESLGCVSTQAVCCSE